MPVNQLSNPTAEENETWSTSNEIIEVLYDPSVTATTTLTNGMVVQVTGGYTVAGGDVTSVGAAGAAPYPVIRKTTTTPNFATLGVVVNAPTGGYVPGSVVQVCVSGIADVLCDANNTTFGGLLITGSTTAGAATYSASATLGKTIGVALATTTISSGTALVPAIIGIK